MWFISLLTIFVCTLTVAIDTLLIYTTIPSTFNGEVAHWICSITGLDIKREEASTRTLYTGL